MPKKKIDKFQKFINENYEKIIEEAKKNTKYNDEGYAVISRDDPWFYEDDWNVPE